MNMLRGIVLAVMSFVPIAASSAGFDCANAVSLVEKLVCQDAELSTLDSELSDRYRKLLVRTKTPGLLKEEQRLWLVGTRGFCTTTSCLREVYLNRIDQLVAQSAWMTNEKERSICETVVSAVNDGSITQKIRSFTPASDADERLWARGFSSESDMYLSRSLKISAHGKSVTLGLVEGRGSCGTCEIHDINASPATDYTSDEADERFRWLHRGDCDHFLFVEDEPIVVTGRLEFGESRATLVSWLAPDGSKRPLCYLHRDEAKEPSKKIVVDKNPELCRSVVNNGIEEISWTFRDWRSPDVGEGSASELPIGTFARLDINLDGNQDTIQFRDESSGGGCGSYRQRIYDDAPSDSLTESVLNKILSASGKGPIKNSIEGDEWYSIKLFRHDGLPYILAAGTMSSAEVISVWGDQEKSWCEYQVLPQYAIETFYPVEQWPARKSSAFKQTNDAQALLNAVIARDDVKARELIENGIPVDAVDYAGYTALSNAAFWGYEEMVKLLLSSGASVDGMPGWPARPVAYATIGNHDQVVQLLIQYGANTSLSSRPRPSSPGDTLSTALEFAKRLETRFSHEPESVAAKKNKHIIELLLNAGAVK